MIGIEPVLWLQIGGLAPASNGFRVLLKNLRQFGFQFVTNRMRHDDLAPLSTKIVGAVFPEK